MKERSMAEDGAADMGDDDMTGMKESGMDDDMTGTKGTTGTHH
jgi:hypothetical protein